MIATTLDFIKRFKLCPQMSREKWLQIVLYMQEKEWIHYLIENGKIVGMWGGWRVDQYSDKVLESLPEAESGYTMYIPFACSEAQDRFIFLKELRQYVGDHDIDEIVFNEFNKNGRLHRIKITK